MSDRSVESEDWALETAAHALSVRARLDALLAEALAAPGLAVAEIERLANWWSSGELGEVQGQLDDLRARSQR